MSETLRERMARAICATDHDIPWEVLETRREPIYADYLADYRKYADAALAVVEETLRPTEERVTRLSKAGWAANPGALNRDDLDLYDYVEGALAEIRREAGIE